MNLVLNTPVPGVNSFLSERTSFVHDTGLLNPPMPGEATEEGGTLHLNSLQKGTNMSSRSLTFHSHLTRQCCAQGRAKDRLQSSEGATMSVQSLTAKPSFRRLGGSPEGKSLTTCSGKAWPEGIKISYSSLLSLLTQPGQRTEQQALLAGKPRVTTTTVGTW